MAAMKLAPHIDHVVLFSGNRDFIPLVQYLQEFGTRVSVASALETPSHHFIADNLRRQADAFIELAKLREQLTNSPVALSAKDPQGTSCWTTRTKTASCPIRTSRNLTLNYLPRSRH